MHRLLLLALLAVTAASPAQLIRLDEAEAAKVTCAAGDRPEGSLWASNGKVTPAFFGRAPGDSVEWTWPLTGAKDLHCSIRYSYHHHHYRSFAGAESADRTLHLVIDDQPPLKLVFPDTGSWDVFDTVDVPLPPLPPGKHAFKLTSPTPHTVANIDCVILSHGGRDKLPAPLRCTVLATSDSKRFVLRATAQAKLRMTPEETFKHFERIYDHYKSAMGWEPPTPVGINLIEDRVWPAGNATAFQNNYGVFFRANVMDTEAGNWCHEMTHMFYVAHFPRWFDEPSVHATTLFDWVPALFPKLASPGHNAFYQRALADAKHFLTTTDRTDDLTKVLCALRVKYGSTLFPRFFQACRAAGVRGDLDFTPGRWLTKAEITRYLSQAAGDDVTPILSRWTGYATAE